MTIAHKSIKFPTLVLLFIAVMVFMTPHDVIAGKMKVILLPGQTDTLKLN